MLQIIRHSQNIFINFNQPPSEVCACTHSINYSIFASNKQSLLCFTTFMLEYLISSRGAIQFVWSGTPVWGQIGEEGTSSWNIEAHTLKNLQIISLNQLTIDTL